MIAIGDAGRVTDFVIRDAVLGDIGALQGVFRRASLSGGGYREVLLAHPEVLELPEQAVREGRTRAAVAEGGIVGFAVTGEVETRFGPAPRMRLDIPPGPL
jgi:hypothetical protein